MAKAPTSRALPSSNLKGMALLTRAMSHCGGFLAARAGRTPATPALAQHDSQETGLRFVLQYCRQLFFPWLVVPPRGGLC
jgi:hypothetical protein